MSYSFVYLVTERVFLRHLKQRKFSIRFRLSYRCDVTGCSITCYCLKAFGDVSKKGFLIERINRNKRKNCLVACNCRADVFWG